MSVNVRKLQTHAVHISDYVKDTSTKSYQDWMIPVSLSPLRHINNMQCFEGSSTLLMAREVYDGQRA